jgi:hypothetical protein
MNPYTPALMGLGVLAVIGVLIIPTPPVAQALSSGS